MAAPRCHSLPKMAAPTSSRPFPAGSRLRQLPLPSRPHASPSRNGGGRILPRLQPRGPARPRRRFPAPQPRAPQPQKGLETLERPRGAAGPRNRRFPGGCGAAGASGGVRRGLGGDLGRVLRGLWGVPELLGTLKFVEKFLNFLGKFFVGV